MTQTFEIPGRLMGLNEYTDSQRANAFRGSRAKKDETERVRMCVRAAGLKPYSTPVEVRIEWVEGRQRNGSMRDIDNIRMGAKFILDALVAEEVIPNDSPRWVRQIYDYYKFNESNPRVVVAVDEYDPRGRTVHYSPVTGV